MMVVVLAHIQVPSVYSYLIDERIGVVTPAEIFIFISGLLIGLIYPKRIHQLGWKKTAGLLLRRSTQLYLISLCVVVAVYLLRFLPGLDSSVLSTYVDMATGRVYDLYPNDGGTAIKFAWNMLILRSGPGQFNIMGLYVVLMLATPVILLLIHRGHVWLLALVSGGLYLFNYLQPTRILPSQFENAFSLLAWQMLFVAAIIIGTFWNTIKVNVQRRASWLLPVLIGAFFGFFLFSLNNPWIEMPGDMRLSWIDPERYTIIYRDMFSRVQLGIGRAVNVIIAFSLGYVLLTWLWKPVYRAFGWFFLPIGQASLFVFAIHLIFVLLFDQIELFQQRHIWLNTFGQTIVLLGIWVSVGLRRQVRSRFQPEFSQPEPPPAL